MLDVSDISHVHVYGVAKYYSGFWELPVGNSERMLIPAKYIYLLRNDGRIKLDLELHSLRDQNVW